MKISGINAQMKTYFLSNYKEMPENIVKDAAACMMDDPDNSFIKLLDVAKEFRDAGLTPIFLCENTMDNIIVTTREKLLRKYH